MVFVQPLFFLVLSFLRWRNASMVLNLNPTVQEKHDTVHSPLLRKCKFKPEYTDFINLLGYAAPFSRARRSSIAAHPVSLDPGASPG